MKNIIILISALAVPAIACVPPTSVPYVSSSVDFTSQHCHDNAGCPRDQGCFLFVDGTTNDGLCVFPR
jgi:hypothetical protein